MMTETKYPAESEQVSQAVQEFLYDYAPETLGRSTHTIKAYQDSLMLFLTFLEEEKGVTEQTLSFGHFDKEMIEAWMDWLQEKRSNSAQTINARLSVLRKFLFYVRKKYPSDPFKRDLYPSAKEILRREVKQSKEKPEILSTEIVHALLESINERKTTGLRDKALYSLMYDAAARVDEILSLKLKDLFLDRNKPHIVFYSTKNGRPRNIAISKETAGLLKSYIRKFHGEEEKRNKESYLFFSRSGGPSVKMTSQNVLDRLKALAAKAHERNELIPVDINNHALRKARARQLLEEGMSLLELSRCLGHEALVTTLKYLGLEDDPDLEEKLADISLAEFAGLRKAKPRKVKTKKEEK